MKLDVKFSLQDFSSWVESFLPEFSNNIRNVAVDNSFKGVKSITTLGESQIGIRVFVISTERDPSSRRVGLAKESFNLIRSYGTPNALIAYHSEESDNWRISLLTSTPEWTDKGIVLSLSNPKRQSYVLGPHSKIHTPYKFLIARGGVINISDLKSRFSLEVVNEEFYKQISLNFQKLVGGSVGSGRNLQQFESLLKLPSENSHSQKSIEFAVRLIGRVIFCWFLREKRSPAGVSLMPKALLSLDAVDSYQHYYHQVLEPIFFEVLNKQVKSRRPDYESDPFSLIPYLNGGLFSPHSDDFYQRESDDFQSELFNTVIIPNSWFKDFFETLETYNFTIDENTSFDEELSIDPEMLGRIFENLLAEINPETGESARKNTGSYYTPRVIVEYMVDESLLLYLSQQTEIDFQKLRVLISYDLTDESVHSLTDSEKERVITALESIKILDPACGSGAFPIGALQKMVFILQQVDPEGRLWFRKQLSNADPELRRDIEKRFSRGEFDYIRKFGLIRNCIYGVDIQPIATEISRLRCFLTLIVDQIVNDEAENRGIRPLPNLEFKFVTANSLIPLPKMDYGQQKLIDDYSQIDELKEIRNLYFDSPSDERESLKSRFYNKQTRIFKDLQKEHGWAGVEKADLTNKLTDWDPFSDKQAEWFDPDWMFGIKDGFNIVLANPPYVGEKGHKEIFRQIKSGGMKDYYQGKMDLFYFFFHLALDVGSENSQIAFISTNYYLTATGAKKLRQDFKKRSIINRLMNFNELKIFRSALGQHNMITLLQKNYNDNEFAKTAITQRQGYAKPEIIQQILNLKDTETVYSRVRQADLYDGDENYIRLSGVSSTINNSFLNVLDKIKRQGTPLKLICNTNQGIVTGADKVSMKHITSFGIQASVGDGIFVLSDSEVEKLNISDQEKIFLKPWFKNSNIYRYCTTKHTSENVIYLRGSEEELLAPALIKHLQQFKTNLQKRREVYKGTRNWFELWRAREESIFTGNKIVAPQRSQRNTFGYNEAPWYASADVYFITEKDNSVSLKYVLALLNSRLIYLWLYHRGKRKGETLELYQKPLSEIPIKKVSLSEQEPFIEIVNKILDITKSADYLQNPDKQARVKELERQIDELVYQLYELTPEEIAVVEGKEENEN